MAKRVEEVVQSAESRLSSDRLERLKQVKERADGLMARGLLRQSEYSSPLPSQLEKFYGFSKR